MNKKIIGILLALCVSASLFAFAETIVLKSGKTVEGKMLEKTDTYIKLNINGMPITYYTDQIERIDGNTVGAKISAPVMDFDEGTRTKGSGRNPGSTRRPCLAMRLGARRGRRAPPEITAFLQPSQ